MREFVIAMSPALRDEEAIQLDRHGALRASRDDNHSPDSSSFDLLSDETRTGAVWWLAPAHANSFGDRDA